jgi:serine/threonine-protein kinase HipA
MRLSPLSQLALMDSVLFDYIIGNADAHAKNHSVVYHGRRADFAPLYDLVSTSVYPELSKEMAMRIGDDAVFASISRDSFSRMAIDCSVSPKLVLGRLDDMVKKIVPAASRLADDCNARYPSNIYSQVLSVIKSNISRIVR